MRVDWIVAIVVFLMFAGWAFAYHSMLSAGKIVSKLETASLAGEKIIDYMSLQASSVPANFSLDSGSDYVTLWAYMNWTGSEKNSTRVVLRQMSNESLPCAITGIGNVFKVYWNASVNAGDNFFFIEYSDLNTTLNCNESVPAVDDNQTTLWAVETRRVFHSARCDEICSQINGSYEKMKNAIGVTFDFNVLVGTAGSAFSCGSDVPKSGREVFIYPATGTLFEGGDINISVRLW
jgi:hypothetical protein